MLKPYGPCKRDAKYNFVRIPGRTLVAFLGSIGMIEGVRLTSRERSEC